MKQIFRRAAGVTAAMAATALVAAGCSSDDAGDAADSAASGASAVTSAVASGASAATSAAGDDAGAGEVELEAADGSKVKLTGPIAAKFNAATDAQKSDLGKPLTGDDASGKGDNGVVFQQFDGGVITAKNEDAGTTAFITWGKIRDAWNVERDESGKPSDDGKGGSAGPLGTATSDETEKDGVKESTFENGKITFDPKTNKVEVTVNGQVVPTE